MNTNEIKLIEATDENPAMVKFWDVYKQSWVVTGHVTDQQYATLSQDERDAIEEHLFTVGGFLRENYSHLEGIRWDMGWHTCSRTGDALQSYVLFEETESGDHVTAPESQYTKEGIESWMEIKKYTYTADIWGSESFEAISLELFQAQVNEIYEAYEENAPDVWETGDGRLMIEDENGTDIEVGEVS